MWFREAPDVENLLSSTKDDVEFFDAVEVISCAGSLASTMHPAISPDTSDARNAPLPNISNKAFAYRVESFYV